MNNDVMRVDVVAADLQRRIGERQTRHLGRISARDAARFHLTIQDGLLADPRDSHGAIHPLLASSVLGWDPGPAEADLMSDGNATETFSGVDLSGFRLMGGGQQLEFGAPVSYDTDLWMDVEIERVEVKEGRTGKFIALTLARTFRDRDHCVHTTCRETFLARREAR